ncbi:hypothetical protein I7I48_11405 [Histoplasma ohiense]|nr:hypothetical protein I7I48_11405 [Histoplasma ohiense (nom. inval.)]
MYAFSVSSFQALIFDMLSSLPRRFSHSFFFTLLFRALFIPARLFAPSSQQDAKVVGRKLS